jgi:antitoxin Phd
VTEWRLAKARNRFSELVTRALREGLNGSDAMILAEHDYEKLTGKKPDFKR